jgi:hypothetical protein
MQKKEILRNRKKKIAVKYFKNRCYVCHRPLAKYFVFHHRYYVDGEPVYSNYNNSLDYQLALLPFIEKNPEQFYLLCKKHHKLVEWLKPFKSDRLERLFEAVRNSQYTAKTNTHESKKGNNI